MLHMFGKRTNKLFFSMFSFGAKKYFISDIPIFLLFNYLFLKNLFFQNQGFTNGKITGIDISSKMLLKASKNNSYKSLHKADIKKKLPMSDNFYDYLICIGTTTYLGTIHSSDTTY